MLPCLPQPASLRQQLFKAAMQQLQQNRPKALGLL